MWCVHVLERTKTNLHAVSEVSECVCVAAIRRGHNVELSPLNWHFFEGLMLRTLSYNQQ